jgi:hypothetical protein
VSFDIETSQVSTRKPARAPAQTHCKRVSTVDVYREQIARCVKEKLATAMWLEPVRADPAHSYGVGHARRFIKTV